MSYEDDQKQNHEWACGDPCGCLCSDCADEYKCICENCHANDECGGNQ